jgi:hypothetical protein
MATRLRALGIDANVYDENIAAWNGDEDIVGFGSIGGPYMATIASRLAELRTRGVSRLMVGGQGVRGLSGNEFSQLFGVETVNGSVDAELVAEGIVPEALPPQESVSIAPTIGALSDDLFRLYFSEEAPLYLS